MPSTNAGHGWPVRIARHIPAIVLAEPWAIFIKALCILSGLTALFGPEPGAIGRELPHWSALLWAVILVAGASSALYGLLRPQTAVEVAGLIWLGTAALVYAGAILLRFQLSSVVGGSMVLGFGLAALTRALAVHVTYELAKQVTERAAAPGAQ